MNRDTEVIKQLARTKLEYFAWLALGWVRPPQAYRSSPALSVLSDMLERCYAGEVKQLIINMPPYSLKSFYTSIAFPAWVLAQRPAARITCYTASRETARDQHALSTDLMTHNSYRLLFPHVNLTSIHRQTIDLIHGGSHTSAIASTHNGVSRLRPGQGSDIIIVDDPVSPTDASRIRNQQSIRRWFDRKVYQRLDNRDDAVVIVVMSRGGVNDLTGHLLKKQGWVWLSLPAIAMGDEMYAGQRFRARGEALCPDIVDRGQYLKILEDLEASDFMAMYQQQPHLPGFLDEAVSHRWGRDRTLDVAVAKQLVFGLESDASRRAQAQAEDEAQRSQFFAKSSAMLGHLSDQELIDLMEEHGLT